MPWVPDGEGDNVEVGVLVGRLDGDINGEDVTPGVLEGEGEGLAFGRSGMMFNATSGTTVATAMITMRIAAISPLFIFLVDDGGGGGGG